MKLLFTLLSFSIALGLNAQTTLQVVTKTVHKTLPWKAGYAIEVNGEKAEIEVEPNYSDPGNVSIKAELTTRHPRLDTAKMDLEAWKFIATQNGNTVYIRAYIAAPSAKSMPSSNLKAKILIKIPPSSPINISNKLGKVQLRQLQGNVRLIGEFCEFKITDQKSALEVHSQYGNIQGQNLEGKVSIDTKRADIKLSGIQGDCSIRCEYGTVELDGLSPSANLMVDSKKTEVKMDIPGTLPHNVELKAAHGNLDIPLGLHLDPASIVGKQSFKRTMGKNRPKIKVESNFGNISIQSL